MLVTADKNLHALIISTVVSFEKKTCKITLAKSVRNSVKLMNSEDFDVCLIDCSFNQQNGLQLLREAALAGCRLPLILIAEDNDERLWLEAMRSGAMLCLTRKSLSEASMLERAMTDALEKIGKLRRQREDDGKFRNLVETLPVMIYSAEPRAPYKPIYISPGFKRFGYPLDKWRKGANFWVRVMHAEDRARVLQETEKAIVLGAETDFEYRIKARDGTEFWVRDRGCFVRDEKGSVVCWQGVILDITKQKRAEQNLQKSEKLYRTLARSIPDTAVLLFDSDFRYTLAECRQLEKHGYRKESFEGKSLWDCFAPDICEEWSDYYHRALEGETTTLEWKTEQAFFQAYVVPVKNECGEIFAGMVMWQDITERKTAENSLRESEERYRNLFENANDLIYIHDLEGNYISTNRAAERAFGYNGEEAAVMNIKDTVAPEHLKFSRQMLMKKLAGEKTTVYEIDCLRRDGNRLTVEINSTVIYKDDKPIAVQGIARDITERKLSEAALRESENQYRELFENANDLIYTHDLQGNFTSLNRAGESITGYTRAEALQINIAQVVAPEYLKAARKMITTKIEGKSPTTYNVEIITKQKQRVSLELSTRIIYQNGAPFGVQGIARDITARKLAEEALVLSERRYRALGEGIKHHVWTAEPDGKLDYVNRRTLEYFGHASGQPSQESWENFVHPDDLNECVSRWQRSVETGCDYEVEFRLRRSDGKFLWHNARATAAFDAAGKITKWFGTNSDINDKKIAEAQLNHNALHDALTNLPNRAKFMTHLERAVNRAECNPTFCFAVIFLDLDRFKLINDSLGHSIGDKLLIAIAARLESGVRPGDIVARLGGDEFTILLNNVTDHTAAAQIAGRLLEKISAPFKLDTYEVFTSASIGIIVSDEIKRLPEDFLRDADTAMYRAKEAGKARYEIFDREMHIRNMNLLQLENDLRRAIEQNEFRVFYQPIIELETGIIREFEALIRWQHPQHGLVQPNEFISIAEETGLIIPIGRWILEEACRQTAEWQKNLPPHSQLSISVNLSAKQLLHPNLTAQVSEILTKTRLNPGHLKLEVTESMVMENSEKALSVIAELHALGISLSTDDFGTGYSSLSYLHRFPFNRLKIDRSFVSKMDSDQKSEAIVRTILLLGQNLDIEVVAEGIETEGQLSNLRQLGCQTGQGFLFSKPIAAEAAARLLENGMKNENAAPFYGFGKTENHQLLELNKVQ